MKIFWRIILPLCLGCLLAAAGTFALIGRSPQQISWYYWWWPDNLYMIAAVFAVLLVASCIKALRWGKEAEEYEELLKEETDTHKHEQDIDQHSREI